MIREIQAEIDREILNDIRNKVAAEQSQLNPLDAYSQSNFIDAGYFYAPYFPMVDTPVVLDTESFNPSVGIATRYGRKLLEGEKYYGKFTVSSLNEQPKEEHKVQRQLLFDWDQD